MAKFIELGKSYGLEPWQFGVQYDRDTGETKFTCRPGGEEGGKRFDAMTKALGLDPNSDSSVIPHEEGSEMFEALDNAIRSAPRRWAR